MEKYVYAFNEGSREMTEELGQKGANLAAMTKLGLPVPFGFTIGTRACRKYFSEGRRFPKEVEAQIREKLAELEYVMGKRLGDPEDPLLLSVRSGAAVSMPGMMDSVINVGLNDETVRGLAEAAGDERFARDAYRLFLENFGNVVLGVPDKAFEAARERAADGRSLTEEYKRVIEEESGAPFVSDPMEQLFLTIAAVFDSWNNENARLYRRLNNIPQDLGTAVTVQRMAFGNLDEDSCTGVCFSRSPVTGEKRLFGEYLPMAQGEEVVAGKRTPRVIRHMAEDFPESFARLERVAALLEREYGDIQDIEFTVEKGRLYILQTRNAKRTALAAVTAAVDMEQTNALPREEALLRVDPTQLVQLLHPHFEEKALEEAVPVGRGLAASPGAASGGVYFHPHDVEQVAKSGGRAILVRQTTTLEDLGSMVLAEGILTKQGGVTCHAAVVARDMDKSCVCGCEQMEINEEEKTLRIGGVLFREGDPISIDGTTGCVYAGSLPAERTRIEGDFFTLMKWADGARSLGVRANASTPREARQAIAFGAEGIGLCRTEHLFLTGSRIHAMRRVLLSDTPEQAGRQLWELLPRHTQDIRQLYEIMEERPLAIRLLDPPLYELVPQNERELAILSELYEMDYDDLAGKVRMMQETNPMMGTRGCRLLLTIPDLCRMQVRAILTAALEVNRERDLSIEPEIMIPMVSTERELAETAALIRETIEEVFEEEGESLPYRLGLMIETPRAALLTDRLAPYVDFLSYGTNDLTQLVMGLSREDSVQIIDMYRKRDIFRHDPFLTIDREGVGRLLEQSVALAKKGKPNIRIAFCGQQSEDPGSLAYFGELGADYVSCSPFNLPLARLAAAQAAIRKD